jgi:micrococcal nuclease
LALASLGIWSCAHDRADESPTPQGDASVGSGGEGGGCAKEVAESTTAICTDGCDNDTNGSADCDDVNCCAIRLDCAGDSACGKKPEGVAWNADLSFDDGALELVEPSSFPSGIRPCRAPALVRVNYAVDGDTLDVAEELGGNWGGRVRVIGVDTPEVAHGDGSAECYGDEAAAFTHQLAGHLVWLTFDSECWDSYNRLLAYVHLGTGTHDSLERQLLRRGLARAFPYGDNRTFEDLFDLDEQDAREAQRGQWGACP